MSREPLGAGAAGPAVGWKEKGGVREKASQGLQYHGGLDDNSCPTLGIPWTVAC